MWHVELFQVTHCLVIFLVGKYGKMEQKQSQAAYWRLRNITLGRGNWNNINNMKMWWGTWRDRQIPWQDEMTKLIGNKSPIILQLCNHKSQMLVCDHYLGQSTNPTNVFIPRCCKVIKSTQILVHVHGVHSPSARALSTMLTITRLCPLSHSSKSIEHSRPWLPFHLLHITYHGSHWFI